MSDTVSVSQLFDILQKAQFDAREFSNMRFIMNYSTHRELLNDPDPSASAYFEEINQCSFQGVPIKLDDLCPEHYICFTHKENWGIE